jgi:soluble lytic murein transglycosylase-like protein
MIRCLTTITILLLAVSSAEAKPWALNDRQVGVAEQIINHLRNLHPTEDPVEYIALAWVESRLTPSAISRTGDYGVLQVNYRIHKRKLRERLRINSTRDLLEIRNNINASVLIVNLMRRKYRHCRGSRVYSCYNGGPGWKRVQQSCLSSCEGQRNCRRCKRAFRYGSLVRKIKRRLMRRHRDLFNAPSE